MPESAKLLGDFDKDWQNPNLSQEYIQDLLAAKTADERVAIIAPGCPPVRSVDEVQELIREEIQKADPVREQKRAAVMSATIKRRWREYRCNGEAKMLTSGEFVAQEALLADIQYYAAQRVEELANKYISSGSGNSENDLVLFTDGCKALLLELWGERHTAFDPWLPYAMYESSILNESRYTTLIPSGRSLESSLRLPLGFPTLQERVDWHIQRFRASAPNSNHCESDPRVKDNGGEKPKAKRGRPKTQVEDRADLEQISANLRKHKKAFTEAEIAEKLGRSTSTIAKHFQGARAPLDLIRPYARLLGVPVTDLLQGTTGARAMRIKNNTENSSEDSD